MASIIVDSSQCHLWTDALHLRQLARDALNKWDRGTYVRMCIITAWIALETSCQEALNAPRIGYSFKADVDEAVTKARLPALDWSQGIWQKVRVLQEQRKSCVHRYLSLLDMFPEANAADDAIRTVRNAIDNIFRLAGKIPPPWLSLDKSRGWHAPSTSSSGCATVYRYGTKPDDPNTVKVFMVVNGQEQLTTVMPAGYDPSEEVDQLMQSVRVPISAIRVYESGQLTRDLIVHMRGNG